MNVSKPFVAVLATLNSPTLALFILCVPPAHATASTNTLPPDTVVQLALAHHPVLKIRAADLQMASSRRLQAKAEIMPHVNARAQALHFEGLENGTLGPGLTIPVIENQYSASIGLTQPLYTGGRVTHQLHGAAYQEAAAQHNVTATAADIELQTLTAYWQWSKALALITAFQDAVTRTGQQLTDTRHLKNAGLATDNDLLANEVLLDQIQLQLQAAQQQADLCRIQLTQLTGCEFTAQHAPINPEAPSTTSPLTLNEALFAALSNRPELISLRLNAKASAALIGVTKAQLRPHLALVARYEQGNPNQRDFPPDAKWRDDAFIGATVTWNLFDGGLTRARTAEAKARAARDDYQTQTLVEAIVAETKSAILARDYALGGFKTAKHAETGASRNLQVATALWKQGSARHSDVLDAQAKLTLTTARRIEAEADILIAEANLKHALFRSP